MNICDKNGKCLRSYLCSNLNTFHRSEGRSSANSLLTLALEILCPSLLEGKQNLLCGYTLCDSRHLKLFRPITQSRGDKWPIGIGYSSSHVLFLDSLIHVFSVQQAKKVLELIWDERLGIEFESWMDNPISSLC